MNPSGLIRWGVLAGLAVVGNAALAQSPPAQQAPGAQATQADQLNQYRQRLLYGPGAAPAMPGSPMGGGMGPSLTQNRMAPGTNIGPGGMQFGPSPMPSGANPAAMPAGTSLPMAGLFGARVTPMMFLSVEDVRYYLTSALDRLKNKRLKLGAVTADEAAITADIVTVDNSLVQRLKVDRHTGIIKYEN
jgi:hypothetical protein